MAAHFTVGPGLAGQMLDADGERLTTIIIMVFMAAMAMLAGLGLVTLVKLMMGWLL